MFSTLQELMLHSKSVTYVMMAVVLVCFVGFWHFLTDKEAPKRRY